MPNSIRRYVGAAFFAATAVLAVASVRATVMEDTVATVNGTPIMLSEYQKQLDSMIQQYKHDAPALLEDKKAVAELRRKVLDQMVDNDLMAQEAEKRKLKIHDRELDNGIAEVKEKNFRRDETGKTLTDAEVEASLADELKKEGVSDEQFRDRIRKQLMIRKVIDEVVRPQVKPPTDDEAKAAYDKIKFIVKGDTSVVAGMSDEEAQAYVFWGQRVREASAERVRVSHILAKVASNASMAEKTQALNRAKDLRDRVDKGEDFADLARKYSDDVESAARGGDIGYVVRGIMPPEFEKAAFSTEVGSVSQPVETEFGYHLIRVTEKRAAESVTYDKMKDDVKQFLMQLHSQEQLDKFVKSLRTDAHIEINLPKNPGDSKGQGS